MMCFHKWHPAKKVYVYLFIIAVFLGIIIAHRFLPRIHFYKLEKEYPDRAVDHSYLIYHDFEKDGFSESIVLIVDQQNDVTNFMVRNFIGNVIQQFNVPGYVSNIENRKNSFSFADINDDNFDELCIFHQDRDSLFLTIIDVKNEQYYIDKSFLLRREHFNKFQKWDIYYSDFQLLDIDNDGTKELIFAIVSGFSLQPRGVFIFDIKEKRITHSFRTNASIIKLHFGDINEDGYQEIIASTYAGGNYPPDSAFSDYYSWLFVFDHQLNLLFPPKKFYGFTSSLQAFAIKYNNRPVIWAFSSYGGVSEFPVKVMFINHRGEIIREKLLPSRFFASYGLFTDEEGEFTVLADQISRQTIQVRPFFTISHQYYHEERLNRFDYVDIDWDKQPELILYGGRQFLIFNRDFDLLTQFPIGELNLGAFHYFSVRMKGPGTLPSFCFSAQNGTHLYRLVKNPLYPWRYSIFFIAVATLYSASALIYRLIMMLSLYFGFLTSYLKNTANGILIINYAGRIVSYNNPFLSLLRLSETFKKKDCFLHILRERKSLVALIQRAIRHHCDIQEYVSFKNGDQIVDVWVSIKPLTVLSGIPYGYMIEVRDRPSSELGDRARLWAKTVQKLAHDIKTPLSSIAVGLKTVEHYVVNSPLKNKDELQEDLQTMRYEIERIHEITKSFLKFTNLEKPNFQIAEIHHSLQRSLERFSEFFERGNIQLNIDLDPDMELFYFDPQQMEIVFNILLENAIDAMEGRGTLSVVTTQVENVIENAPRLCEIEITDSGPGIPPDEQENVFEPFFTTKKEGTGMGLTIARKIIEDHNGSITFYSKENLGTTFRITLPMRK